MALLLMVVNGFAQTKTNENMVTYHKIQVEDCNVFYREAGAKVLVTFVGTIAFHQKPDLPAVLGMALIVAGVVVINLFSKMSVH